jgi:hypothetical protein
LREVRARVPLPGRGVVGGPGLPPLRVRGDPAGRGGRAEAAEAGT